jgi:hypothetical protein
MARKHESDWRDLKMTIQEAHRARDERETDKLLEREWGAYDQLEREY